MCRLCEPIHGSSENYGPMSVINAHMQEIIGQYLCSSSEIIMHMPIKSEITVHINENYRAYNP